jgi:NAD(P)-dependent dehydrogenase (short-subunit alcohol dehydrogenase family)
MERLKGKRALITGGTSGIGLETARQFLNEGARIAITGKNQTTLETARQELGREALIIPSDASDLADQKRVADTLRQVLGGDRMAQPTMHAKFTLANRVRHFSYSSAGRSINTGQHRQYCASWRLVGGALISVHFKGNQRRSAKMAR